jgi:large subunit ribosomal protein L25
MTVTLKAMERTDFKKSTLRKIREDGNIPAIVYGKNKESKAIFINSGDFLKTIRETGLTGIITLELNNEKHPVILHEFQRDPIKSNILHLDFQIVDMSTEVEVDVFVHLIGEAKGVKDGGVLQQTLHQLTVRALPNNIPKSIDIDISQLEVGESVTVGDIDTGGKYEILHEESQVIASILPPQQEVEINSGEQQEPGEPNNQEGRETNEE